MKAVLVQLEEKYKMADSKDEIISQLRTLVSKYEQDFLAFMRKTEKKQEVHKRIMMQLDDLKHDRKFLKDKAKLKMI